MHDSPLDLEAPFPDLWAYEGVTAYVDDWFLRRSNTRSVEDYLRVLGESLTRLQRTPGRHYQSLVEGQRGRLDPALSTGPAPAAEHRQLLPEGRHGGAGTGPGRCAWKATASST